MAGHHAHHPAFDSSAEGGELERVEAGPLEGQHRQVAVRIDGRIAVAGEVLGGSEHAALLRAVHERRDHGAYQPWPLAK